MRGKVKKQAETSEEKSGKDKKPDTPPRNPWFLWTRDIIICLIIVLFFRGYVAEANYIPSPSMEPTLNVSDRIIVDKLSMRWRPLERGDLVVFHPPVQAGQGHMNERWIKRVIGLPGETVEIIDGRVYINGHRLEESYVQNSPLYSVGPIVLRNDDPSTSVNEGEYYLLGDNRQNSKDSHVWGACTEDRIIGRAIFRYWPLTQMGSLTNSDKEPILETDD
jgi:signal peptidase I